MRENSQSNELFNNTITSSNESGIYLLDYSTDNRIYNNYFNNTLNVKAENSEGNIWNTTKTSGQNIVEGPYLGGNFWADLNGTGFSQTTEDSDSDGICDLPYNINGSDFDYLPLAKPPVQPEDDQLLLIEYQITTNESYQGNPAIYNDWIVWQDKRNGNQDIYMYDLSTKKKKTQITTSESDKEYPAIYGDRIVLVDYRNLSFFWEELSDKSWRSHFLVSHFIMSHFIIIEF